jgi:tellurite resistance protein TerC
MAATPSSSALVTIDRQYLYSSFHDGVQYTLREAFSHDGHYTLFRSEDWLAWVVFSLVFVVLLMFDNCVLNRRRESLTIGRAIAYTFFWVSCACGFCGWIYYYYGESAAFMWMSGYMLEWMLSFDNLFVFHVVFSVYATPDHLKHRPLYLGIWGAIIFRLAFIFCGEYLMHAMFFMHFIFGSFLIYTGFKTLVADDDDDDPSQHPLVQWLQRRVPFVSAYDEQGAFFVRVPLDQHNEPLLPCVSAEGRAGTAERAEAGQIPAARYGTIDFAHVAEANVVPHRRSQLRATMLFLVVCCIEISDLLFAVDSVSAIVAQVNDLFLAYTSAVFAMLGLRATFFIIDVLAKVFTLLKYGVAAVLMFIGVKLCCSRMIHIPPNVVCVVLVSSIAASMIASVVQEEVVRVMSKAQQKVWKVAGTTEKSPLVRSRTL